MKLREARAYAAHYACTIQPVATRVRGLYKLADPEGASRTMFSVLLIEEVEEEEWELNESSFEFHEALKEVINEQMIPTRRTQIGGSNSPDW